MVKAQWVRRKEIPLVSSGNACKLSSSVTVIASILLLATSFIYRHCNDGRVSCYNVGDNAPFVYSYLEPAQRQLVSVPATTPGGRGGSDSDCGGRTGSTFGKTFGHSSIILGGVHQPANVSCYWSGKHFFDHWDVYAGQLHRFVRRKFFVLRYSVLWSVAVSRDGVPLSSLPLRLVLGVAYGFSFSCLSSNCSFSEGLN